MTFGTAVVFDDDRVQFDTTIVGFDGALFLSGTVTGLILNTGTVTGGPGFTGTSGGASSNTGSALGIYGVSGTAGGTTSSTGTATGTLGASTAITGFTDSTGSATGSPNIFGSITGTSTPSGAATGSPSLTGQTSGTLTSTGQASGSPDTPPPPPVQEPVQETGAGPRLFYPQPKPQPVPLLAGTGQVRGTTISTGRLLGRCGYTGVVRHGQTTGGNMRAGFRWPDDREIKRRQQRAEENELVTLGIL
jgi:hypothetical protein